MAQWLYLDLEFQRPAIACAVTTDIIENWHLFSKHTALQKDIANKNSMEILRAPRTHSFFSTSDSVPIIQESLVDVPGILVDQLGQLKVVVGMTFGGER